MKLVLAIINNDDSAVASAALTAVGNTTLLVGTEDERVEELVAILKQYCSTHRKVTSTADSLGRGLRPDGIPPKITVGGATYFVLNVEDMGKL